MRKLRPREEKRSYAGEIWGIFFATYPWSLQKGDIRSLDCLLLWSGNSRHPNIPPNGHFAILLKIPQLWRICCSQPSCFWHLSFQPFPHTSHQRALPKRQNWTSLSLPTTFCGSFFLLAQSPNCLPGCGGSCMIQSLLNTQPRLLLTLPTSALRGLPALLHFWISAYAFPSVPTLLALNWMMDF